MSRSKKHAPYQANAGARSEKADKQQWHGALRARDRGIFARAPLGEDVVVTVAHDVSDPWGMAKDGRSYSGKDWLRRIANRAASYYPNASASDQHSRVNRKFAQLSAK